MARPKKNTVQLSDIDVKKLKGILQKTDTCQTIVNRCRILLALDEIIRPYGLMTSVLLYFASAVLPYQMLRKLMLRMDWMLSLKSNAISTPVMSAVK